MSKVFWNIKNDSTSAELIIDGVIATYGWWGDEVTPKQFAEDLAKVKGKALTVWLNSPGGDVFAGSRIYTMLMEHKGGVTVKIDGLAASAASVIAMAGDEILMSPTSMMMIHNPTTSAEGDSEDMRKAKALLDECKESIINAYEIKTSLSREEISTLMDEETWFSAASAIEKGFADGVLAKKGGVKNLTVFNSIMMSHSVADSGAEFAPKSETSIEALKLKLKLLGLQ